MNRFRHSHTTTLLANGKVLVTGGYGDTPDEPHPNHKTGPIPWAEVLDPLTGSWSETGEMASIRYDHTAIPLNNGTVLVFGGGNPEVYTPDTGSWSSAGLLYQSGFPAIREVVGTLLQSGKLIITGSSNGSAQLYDPVTQSLSMTPPGGPQSAHTATLLANGTVLTVEGYDIIRCAVYSPLSNTWSTTGSPLEPRYSQSACLLPSGKVLMFGGLGFRNSKYGFPLTSTEIYNPATGKWAAASPTGKSRLVPFLVRIGDTRILSVGGKNSETSNTAKIYDESTNSWTPTSPVLEARSNFSLTSLDGGILATGGIGNSILPSVEIYDPPFPQIAVEQPVGTEVQPSVSKNFGTVAAGSGKILQFTVRNVGASDLTGLTVSKTGATPGDFDLELKSGGGLAPGSATILTVAFNPASAGNKSATLHLLFNDNGGNSFDIHLNGRADGAPEIVVEQPSKTNLVDGKAKKSFGTLKVGNSGPAKIFTIKNTGTAKLTNLAIRKDGTAKSDFSIGSLARTTLAPGASTTFKVIFKPSAKGTRDAAIHIKSNDADENPFDIKLSGAGASR